MQIAPGNLKITIQRGVTFSGVRVTCRDDAGSVVPLAGWKAHALARPNPKSDEVLLDLDPQIATDDADGLVTIPEISYSNTAAMTEAKGYWDLVLETPDGKRLPPTLAGIFEILTINTRPQ